MTGFMACGMMLYGVSVAAAPVSIGVRELSAKCAPSANPRTMQFLIQNESKTYIYALNVNGNWHLARQPRDEREAVGFARWLLAHGMSFDVGLMQINSANFSKTGLSLHDLFEPCHNLRAGYVVLADCYKRALYQDGNNQIALRKALSCYNTGSFTAGFRNGYVQKVVAIAQASSGEDAQVLIPELIPDKPGKKRASVPETSSVPVRHDDADNGAFGSDGAGENDQFEEQETAAKQSLVDNRGKKKGDAERISGSSSDAGELGSGKGGV
jgi:type IV secretion system protein VirB1